MSEEVNNDQPVIDAVVEPVIDTPAPIDETVVTEHTESVPADETKPKTVPIDRFLKVNTEKNQYKAKIAELEQALASAPANTEVKPLTEADILRKAQEIAAAKDIEVKSTRILNNGNKEYSKEGFAEILQTLTTVGEISNTMVEILDDVGDGEKILQYLADNLDDAEKILNANPTKQALEIAKLHNKITAPLKKKVSAAPPPITPIGGSSKFSGIDINDKSIPVADRIREMKRLEQIEYEKKYKR